MLTILSMLRRNVWVISFPLFTLLGEGLLSVAEDPKLSGRAAAGRAFLWTSLEFIANRPINGPACANGWSPHALRCYKRMGNTCAFAVTVEISRSFTAFNCMGQEGTDCTSVLPEGGPPPRRQSKILVPGPKSGFLKILVPQHFFGALPQGPLSKKSL